MEGLAPYAPHLIVGGALLLGVAAGLWHLRVDPVEHKKQVRDYYRRLYAKDAQQISRR